MVMLMIKFGAYKAACCWVCAPSFSRRQQLMTRRREKGFGRARKESEKSGFRTQTFGSPPFFCSFFLSFSPPSPPPQEEEALSSLLIRTKGRKRERERCRYHRKRLGHR